MWEEDSVVLLLCMNLCLLACFIQQGLFLLPKSLKWFLADVCKENASF